MQLIRGIHNIRAHHYRCVLTIGNFDGVHRGHQAVLGQLKTEGERLGLPSMAMLFEPQPLEMFSSDQAPARLTRLRDKVKYLHKAGIDCLLCVKFDPHFASNTAQGFISEVIVKKLGVNLLIVGDDFRFGEKRQGDFMLLQQAGKDYGFDVISVSTLREAGQRISSTTIRNALETDALPLAENFLGRPYSISGKVVYGDGVGRTIGFPTANLLLKRLVAPVRGVYAVEVHGPCPDPIPGIANIGTRPTLFGACQQLEVHLLNLKMNLYGHNIDVVLRMKIRNEEQFASLDVLRRQIANDVLEAQKFFRVKT